MKDPRRTTTDLGRAYWANHARAISIIQPEIFGFVEMEYLEGIEIRAKATPGSPIAQIHRDLINMLKAGEFADKTKRDLFKTRYNEGISITFPVTAAYLKHVHDLMKWTQNHSLSSINIDVLRDIDLLAHDDATYRDFCNQMKSKIGDNIKSPNIVSYNQFFEVYCEAMTLRYLRGRPGLRVSRVPDGAVEKEKRPDFQCYLEDGTTFYVEVKALDIVGGELRHDEMMVDAIDTKVELDRQRQQGARIAIAEGVTAPYQAYGETDTYDHRSVARVIDTLRKKFFQAFKPGQFELGPTFALTVVDRLIIPGGKCALAPYFYDDYEGGCCISGSIWQAAFGTPGAAIFRQPEFEGKPALEGHLQEFGYFVDAGRPFPGIGLIVLTPEGEERRGYGLVADHPPFGDWTAETTEVALGVICDAFNDGGNTHSSELSRYARGE